MPENDLVILPRICEQCQKPDWKRGPQFDYWPDVKYSDHPKMFCSLDCLSSYLHFVSKSEEEVAILKMQRTVSYLIIGGLMDDYQQLLKKEYAAANEAIAEEWAKLPWGVCPDCGLPMVMHDGSDFCPPGTEEFGGRR